MIRSVYAPSTADLLIQPARRLLAATLAFAASLALAAALAVAAPPPPVADGGFTLVVLPDTQNYAAKFPDTYFAQTRWIAANLERHHIVHVLHVGDITDHNVRAEWQVAHDAHALLAGKVPVALIPGNHDLGFDAKHTTRETLLTEFFPLAGFQRWTGFGGVYDREPDRVDNSCHLFAAGGRKWLIVGLEFAPRNDVLRWAGEVVARHPDRSVIYLTHAYLRPDNSRYDRQVPLPNAKLPNKGLDNFLLRQTSTDGFNDGEDVWRKLVAPHANSLLVISGHVCFTGRLTSTGEHGNPVHEMVVDYQNGENGGNGVLRLLQFLPDGKTLRVRDYSPITDETVTTADRVYDLALPAAPAAKP